MRAFIAIDIPAEIRGELMKIQQKLSEVQTLKAKFVEAENFHLTLKFLGEISDARVNQIKERLSEVKFPKFKALFGQLGTFPSPNYVRVIWISLEPEEKVKELTKAINEVLKSKDERFESHVTLARVKNIENKELLQKKLTTIKFEKKSFEVSFIKLKKSTLTPKGPIYEDVVSFDLT